MGLWGKDGFGEEREIGLWGKEGFEREKYNGGGHGRGKQELIDEKRRRKSERDRNEVLIVCGRHF